MKSYLTLIFTTLCLSISFSTAAQSLSGQFTHAWGSGSLLTDRSGTVHHVTDGSGKPDLIVAPLKSNGFSGQNLYFEIMINKMANLSGIEMRLGDREFKNYYALSIPYFKDSDFNIIQDKYWQSYSFGLTNARIVGNPKNKVEWFGVYFQDNGEGPLDISLRNVRFAPAPKTGYVSITFDDGYTDTYHAAQIMGKYGLPGTAYIMPRQVAQPSYMTLQQINELSHKYKWAISSHNAIPYTEFTPDELEREIDFTLSFLSNSGFSLTAPHLAYPLGKQNRSTVLPFVRRHFKTARVASGGIETLPPADMYLLRSDNVLDTTKPEELIEVVKKAVHNGQWAILMFHHLVEQPHLPTEYRTQDFAEFIDLLAKAKVPVLTVEQVYRKIHPSEVTNIGQ